MGYQLATPDFTDHDRCKDEFIAMLGHELRNPLAPIANALQILRLQEHESQSGRQAREIIERQLTQLQLLVRDMLDLSRMATGKIRLHQERTAVRSFVEHAVETVRPLVDQRHHHLTLGLPPEPLFLLGDSARLEQLLVNLLTNAAKYTDDGGDIRLTVQQEGDTVVMRVCDTGVGIAPDLLPHIFDMFKQAEGSLHRSEGGLGIGLSLVRRLAELHGGRVEATSMIGEGSEFVVRLPILVEDTLPPQLDCSPARDSRQRVLWPDLHCGPAPAKQSPSAGNLAALPAAF